MKNRETLNSFVRYCQKNPELRFWQALRSWSGFSFIFGWDCISDSNELRDKASALGMEDTFYFKGKDK